MSMILRSMIGKVVRRSFSLEGILSNHLPQPLRRCIHADRGAVNCTHEAEVDASRASLLPRSAEVDRLVQKVEDVAKKEVLLECAQSLVEEQKKAYGSLNSEGSAYPLLFGVALTALVMAGYGLGVDQATMKFQNKKVKERN